MACSEHGGDGYSSDCIICHLAALEESNSQQTQHYLEVEKIKLERENRLREEARLEAEKTAKQRVLQEKRSINETCPFCHGAAKGFDNICRYCGKTLQRKCLNCGEENFLSWDYCIYCELDEKDAQQKLEEEKILKIAREQAEAAEQLRKKRAEEEELSLRDKKRSQMEAAESEAIETKDTSFSSFLILVCIAVLFSVIWIIHEKNSENLSLAQLDNVHESPTNDGYIGVYSNLTNNSDTTMKTVEVTIYYYDKNNKVIYSENQEVSNINSGQTTEIGFDKKIVHDSVDIEEDITKVDF